MSCHYFKANKIEIKPIVVYSAVGFFNNKME
ncbi:hypothetical protein OA78_2212 [Latilactobacillus curvatus]|nr:hypothetical protein OA78_2212 [Latilactobacillus curvatus]